MNEQNLNAGSNKNFSTPGASEGIDLGFIVSLIAKKKIIIIFTSLLFTFFGFCYGLIATPTYQANALIQVESNSGDALAFDGLTDMISAESSSDTEMLIIKSRFVLNKTVDELNLTNIVHPNHFPVLGEFFARRYRSEGLAQPKWGAGYAWGGESLLLESFVVNNRYLGKEFILVANGGSEFSLWINDQELLTGNVGETISNDISDVQIKLTELVAHKGTRFTLIKYSRLRATMELQKDLKLTTKGNDTGIIELSLLGKNKKNLVAILDSISDNYLSQNVKRLAAEAESSLIFINEQIPYVRSALVKSEAALNSYRAARDSVDLNIETKSLLEQLVILDADINSMALNEADMSRIYTNQHPSYLSFKRKQRDLQTQRNQIDSKITDLPETQQKVLSLMRDFEVNQQIYISLQNKSQELAILKASTVGNVRVLDSAEVFPKPTSPKKALINSVAFLLGAISSLLFVLVQLVFNRGVTNVDELQKTGLNTYATIPISPVQMEVDRQLHSRKANSNTVACDRLLLAASHPVDLAVEAIRSLRTSLHFSLMEAENNIIMISSGSAELGKSFIASNLAAVLAQSGQKVLLIDVDMRRGHLHSRFSIELGNGLSDYLVGSIDLEEVIRDTSIDNLSLISRGSIYPNPSELLMGVKLELLLKRVSDEYDVVIVDTPPVLAVTDAAIVGRYAGTVMLVARYEKSTLREVQDSLSRFQINGIEIKGLIFNAIDTKGSSYYGGYYNYSYVSDSPH